MNPEQWGFEVKLKDRRVSYLSPVTLICSAHVTTSSSFLTLVLVLVAKIIMYQGSDIISVCLERCTE